MSSGRKIHRNRARILWALVKPAVGETFHFSKYCIAAFAPSDSIEERHKWCSRKFGCLGGDAHERPSDAKSQPVKSIVVHSPQLLADFKCIVRPKADSMGSAGKGAKGGGKGKGKKGKGKNKGKSSQGVSKKHLNRW